MHSVGVTVAYGSTEIIIVAFKLTRDLRSPAGGPACRAAQADPAATAGGGRAPAAGPTVTVT